MKVKSDWFKKQRLYPFLKINKIRVCWRRENAYISAVFGSFFTIFSLKDVSSALKSFCQKSLWYLLWFKRYLRKTAKLENFLQHNFYDLITLASDWSLKVFPHTSEFGLCCFGIEKSRVWQLENQTVSVFSLLNVHRKNDWKRKRRKRIGQRRCQTSQKNLTW